MNTPLLSLRSTAFALVCALLSACDDDDNDGDTAAADDTAATEESSGGDSSSDAESDSDESSGSSAEDTGPVTYQNVSGTIGLIPDLTFWDGNDGIGLASLAALPECASGVTPVAATVIEDADLSAAGATVPFTLEDVPTGTHYIVAFLDDNENYDPNAPAPDQGDIVLANGATMGCEEVTVESADLTGVEINLNLVLPF